MEKTDQAVTEGVIDGSAESNPSIEMATDADRALLRKIDWRVMPVVSLIVEHVAEYVY